MSTGLTPKQILQQKQQPYQNCDLEIIPESRTPTHTQHCVPPVVCPLEVCKSSGTARCSVIIVRRASGRAERSRRVAVPLAKKKVDNRRRRQVAAESSNTASAHGHRNTVCVCARARCRHRSVRSVRPDTVGQPKGREKRVCGPAAHGDSTHTHLSRHVSCARELFLFFQHPAHQQQPLFDHHFHW